MDTGWTIFKKVLNLLLVTVKFCVAIQANKVFVFPFDARHPNNKAIEKLNLQQLIFLLILLMVCLSIEL